MSKRIDAIKYLDFGDIDGLYDPNLANYFVDNNYWESIINERKYFIIGRKGTGKSALYNWINNKQGDKGVLISNLSFKDFPFEKLLSLSDDNFSKPNQYQSIWRNIILSEISKLLIKDQNNIVDDEFREIKDFVLHVFGTDLSDLHKKVTKNASKSNIGLSLNFLKGGVENSAERELSDSYYNITKINQSLDSTIRKYLKVNGKTKYVIQFDQLDDNYTSYIDNPNYFQCIISLFKAIYDINQTYRLENIDVQIIAYLRSDIYNSIDAFDAESARWDQYKFNLNWAIVNQTDWQNPSLLMIINKRIWASLKSLLNENAFQLLFEDGIALKDKKAGQSVFKYIIHRSFHRPRDVIQFCKKIQDEVKKSNDYFFRSIKNAEKEYSLWLLSEVANEIAPKVNNLDSLYELLRLLGSNPFSINDFKTRYNKYKALIKLDSEELLKILYSFGIISNISGHKDYNEYYSIIRNDRSVFNRDLKIITHPGFYQGLYISKFLRK